MEDSNKIVLESSIVNDEYTDYICESYDIQNREIVRTEIPMVNVDELGTFSWNVGIILGNSGSGKSTILSRLGEIVSPTYDNDKCVISQFPMLSPKDACELLCGVGLASVPTWLKKPFELSNGERARLDLAYVLSRNDGETPILIDEFTSVVNRKAAASMSYSLQRYVRTHNLKVILGSCHFDILEFLTPDWIFNLNKSDDKTEIERIEYASSKEYVTYPKVDEKLILSEKRSL